MENIGILHFLIKIFFSLISHYYESPLTKVFAITWANLQ
jgi:hypothetical protein